MEHCRVAERALVAALVMGQVDPADLSGRLHPLDFTDPAAAALMAEAGLPDDAPNVNPNGGAISIGHPLGASGARLALTALRGLEETGGRRALVTLCIGVGQGAAMALERL